jgi:hypothetical protein
MGKVFRAVMGAVGGDLKAAEGEPSKNIRNRPGPEPKHPPRPPSSPFRDRLVGDLAPLTEAEVVGIVEAGLGAPAPPDMRESIKRHRAANARPVRKETEAERHDRVLGFFRSQARPVSEAPQARANAGTAPSPTHEAFVDGINRNRKGAA